MAVKSGLKVQSEKELPFISLCQKEATMAKILIAEVEIDISFIVETVLVKTGYAVITAFDGETALAKALAEKPDLILLDIMMPKMDGFTVNSKLKENPFQVNMLLDKVKEVLEGKK